MTVDILAVGAHPDDVELAMAGSLLVFAAQGKSTAIVDLTRGELGSRGTPEVRAAEAAEASKVLGLSVRENLNLPDGRVQDDPASRLALVGALRRCRPRLVFTHHPQDAAGHPDHAACSALVRSAVYLAGLARVDTGQLRHRAEAVIFFNLPRSQFPSFIVDVSQVYARRREALGAYHSQFHNPSSSEPETYLSHPRFLDSLEATHRYWGGGVGIEYGEAFWCERPLKVTDPTLHFGRGL